MLQLALVAFSGLSLTTRLIAIGGVVLAFITAGGVVYVKIEHHGYNRAIHDIARQNARAVKAADDLRSKFRDCDARGMRWVQSTGQCE